MSPPAETDLLILGAGPGGYAAAFLAADKGMQVTLVDPLDRPGGTCLHVGCIPSKTLLHVAKLLGEARDLSHFGVDFGPPKINLDALRAQALKIVDTMNKNLAELAKRRKVEYVKSRATFASSNSVKLDDGSVRRFKSCIIAVGSLPARPPTFAIESRRLMDSTGALKLEEVPESLLVVGGGYIGLELGCVYSALGSKVTVVELTDGLLPGADRDLVRPLANRLEKQFHKIYLNTKVTQVEDTSKGIKVSLEGDEAKEKEQLFGRVLVAVGRRPNSRGLGLENTLIQMDEKGFIKTDNQRRSTDPNIFAIGDIAGEPMLAHKASFEGKLAVEVLAGEKVEYDVRAMPAVVFTDPEIAWCGLSESEAKKTGREVQVSRFPWGASGRAQSLGRTEGLTKIIMEPETERVLGVGIVGPGAGELIAEGVLAVEMSATAKDLALSIHPHPTLSETLMEAAESLFGPTTHMFKARK